MVNTPVLRRLAAILTGLWAGSLLTVCALVAPALFAALDERRLAGEIAGELFRIEAWLGAVMGSVVAGLAYAHRRGLGRVELGLIALTAGGPLASELALRPLLDAARSAGDMARFGMLHGASMLLFAIACVSALVLAWRISRPAA